MDVVQGLGSFDPQGLSPDQLQQAIDRLGIAALRAKAAAQLQPAFVAESAGFQGFGHIALQRLESTLQYVFITPDSLATEKIKALRELDAISFIVCGLCLSKKSLVRLDRDLFKEVVRQARGSSHRLVNIIITSDEVADVVRKSGAEVFKQSTSINANTWTAILMRLDLDQLLELRIGAQSPEASLSLAGLPSWCYSVPSRRTNKFGRLVASAVGGAVSTYIPIRPEYADCLIRVVMTFNDNLLKTLFGMENQEYKAGMAFVTALVVAIILI